MQAAAPNLGLIVTESGDISLNSRDIAILEKPDLNILVKIEVVWAIGKSPDFRAHSALEDLENKIWIRRSEKPEFQKLREAVD